MRPDDSKKILPATNSGPRPGSFPLGSPESRAAARMLAEARQARSLVGRKIFRVIISGIAEKSTDLSKVTCTRTVSKEGGLLEVVNFIGIDGSAGELTGSELEKFIARFPVKEQYT